MSGKLSIDESAVELLAGMGFSEPLPEGLVRIYREFKRLKDKVYPGRPTPESMALLVCMYNMSERKGCDSGCHADDKKFDSPVVEKKIESKSENAPLVYKAGDVIAVKLHGKEVEAKVLEPEAKGELTVEIKGDTRKVRLIPVEDVVVKQK